MSKFKLIFRGGVGEVTGSMFEVHMAGEKILVDCGFLQGGKSDYESNYDEFVFDPASISHLFITHAHIDHIGRIIILRQRGFSGKIYSTNETKQLAQLMMEDEVAIEAMNARKEGREPRLSPADISAVESLWETIDYRRPRKFGDFEVELYDSGHILGSAMVRLETGGKSLLLTGDLGNPLSSLEAPTEVPVGIDYMVMESVYGDRKHDEKEELGEGLKKVILEAIENKGVLLIPSFSLERTQALLFELNNLFENSKVPLIPVFLDSPLAIKVTEIYEKSVSRMNSHANEVSKHDSNIFSFSNLKKIMSNFESGHIDSVKSPKIIIAGSGMSEGGRVRSHEKQILTGKDNTILFIGYQSAMSLGRRILNGDTEVNIDKSRVRVRAKIRHIFGFSSHADSDDLVNFVDSIKPTPKIVFTAMGEPKASLFLAQRLHDELGVNAVFPKLNSEYNLD